MQKTVKFRVSGRVQGVFFRVSTKQQADTLELGGWVSNCKNGDVEGSATGEEEQLNLFIHWLGQGPGMAHVRKLQIDDCAYQTFDDFIVR